MKRPIMGVANILDLQNNGYKSTVSAISEIIDNSIQANATAVDIYIVRNTTRRSNEIDEIIIVDNGSGMNMEEFDKALQMSNGTRTKASSGLGRYGMGLPNSSISQTKRVEVYTKNKSLLYNHIDLEEIFSNGEPFLDDVEERDKIDIPLFTKLDINPLQNKGTVVRWVNPNKLSLRTAKSLSENIEKLVGRVFRYFIKGHKEDDKTYQSKISVYVYEYNGSNYSIDNNNTRKEIQPFDPMFLMKNTQMDAQFTQSEHPTSELYDEKPFSKEFKITNSNGVIEKGKINIAISYCKKTERDRYGKKAGGTKFGEKYLKRNLLHGNSGYQNISIVRSGREIDAGSFGFIGDVSDPRHRWWSAEICFSPIFDDILGVDNKKQHASKITFLDKDSIDSEDVHEAIKWIHKYLSGNIDSVKKLIDSQNAKTNSSNKEKHLLPGAVTEEGSEVKNPETNDDKIKKEFYEWIKERYKKLEDIKIYKIIDYALGIRDHHIFVASDLGDTPLYAFKVIGTKVLIEINFRHSYYKKFIQKFEEDDDEISKRAAYLLIGSLVNSEIECSTNNDLIIRDRRNLRNKMSTTLWDYISDLYSN